jgi:poly(beta-D-mannuronate) lyase
MRAPPISPACCACRGAPRVRLKAHPAVLALLLTATAALADCPAAPDPVLGLAFDSRYTDDSETRSEIDPEAEAAAKAALRPVDDFLRDLARRANTALDGSDPAAAGCVVAQIARWAGADALAGLDSPTARLSVGARLAGFALVLLQAAPLAGDADAVTAIDGWLTRRLSEQIAFWEEDAPDGARTGNLRAWAALAAAATAARTGDPALRYWAAASAAHVLCSAAADGSLPQEMRRGRLALQYQLHAITPLVVTALLLDRQGLPLTGVCGAALDRAVGFALSDLDDGAASATLSGEVQSFFDGSDKIEDFHLAWIEAYLRLPAAAHAAQAEALVKPRRPLTYSKLGGNQTLIWDHLR